MYIHKLCRYSTWTFIFFCIAPLICVTVLDLRLLRWEKKGTLTIIIPSLTSNNYFKISTHLEITWRSNANFSTADASILISWKFQEENFRNERNYASDNYNSLDQSTLHSVLRTLIEMWVVQGFGKLLQLKWIFLQHVGCYLHSFLEI